MPGSSLSSLFPPHQEEEEATGRLWEHRQSLASTFLSPAFSIKYQLLKIYNEQKCVLHLEVQQLTHTSCLLQLLWALFWVGGVSSCLVWSWKPDWGNVEMKKPTDAHTEKLVLGGPCLPWRRKLWQLGFAYTPFNLLYILTGGSEKGFAMLLGLTQRRCCPFPGPEALRSLTWPCSRQQCTCPLKILSTPLRGGHLKVTD